MLSGDYDGVVPPPAVITSNDHSATDLDLKRFLPLGSTTCPLNRSLLAVGSTVNDYKLSFVLHTPCEEASHGNLQIQTRFQPRESVHCTSPLFYIHFSPETAAPACCVLNVRPQTNKCARRFTSASYNRKTHEPRMFCSHPCPAIHNTIVTARLTPKPLCDLGRLSCFNHLIDGQGAIPEI